MEWLANVIKTPVVQELIELAGAYAKLHVEYREEPKVVESTKNIISIETHGSIWTNESLGVYFGAPYFNEFWKEFERLEALITKPLDEPILEDDYPVNQGG